MPLHFEPVMYVVRRFATVDGYDNRDHYDLVFSVFNLGHGRARAFAAHGEIDRASLREAAAGLRERGIHTLLVDRHGVEQEWKLSQLPPTAPSDGH